jgi:HK97 gp10 family phage protein
MKIRGTSQVLNRLKRVSSQATLQTKSAVVRNTDQIYAQALSNVPVLDGYLRGSGNTSYSSNQLTGTVAFGGQAAPYAPYVEFGTGKNKVIPLGFEDYAMQFYVNGEGTMQPQPYLIPAYLKYKKVFLNDLRKIAKNISK